MTTACLVVPTAFGRSTVACSMPGAWQHTAAANWLARALTRAGFSTSGCTGSAFEPTAPSRQPLGADRARDAHDTRIEPPRARLASKAPASHETIDWIRGCRREHIPSGVRSHRLRAYASAWPSESASRGRERRGSRLRPKGGTPTCLELHSRLQRRRRRTAQLPLRRRRWGWQLGHAKLPVVLNRPARPEVRRGRR